MRRAVCLCSVGVAVVIHWQLRQGSEPSSKVVGACACVGHWAWFVLQLGVDPVGRLAQCSDE
jgi:hypothetical protein